MKARDLFLIVESENVVAEDLSQTVELFRPGARVLHARSAGEAMSLLAPGQTPTVAILDLTTCEMQESGLLSRLRKLGANVLQITDDEASEGDWGHLLTPFSAEMVITALRGLGLGRCV